MPATPLPADEVAVTPKMAGTVEPAIEVGEDGHPIPVIQGEVVATGVAVQSTISSLGATLEQAMVDAINWCYANGITAPEAILAKKMEAFEAAKAAYEANH